MKGLAAPFTPVYGRRAAVVRKKACTNPGISGIIKETRREDGVHMAAGFIHDKLEIKFLILYIAARSRSRPCRS